MTVRRRQAAWIGLLVLSYLAVGAVATRVAQRAWHAVVDYAPPYRFEEGEASGTPPLADRVLLVVVDGLRLDASRELPFLNHLRREGADLDCAAGTPSLSRPGRAALATGAWPSLHGATTNFHQKALVVDNVFRRAEAAGLSRAVAGSHHWRSLFAPDLEGASILEWPKEKEPRPFRQRERSFQEFGERAVELVATAGARLAVVDFLATDDAAHDHGSASEEYRRAARSTDAMLGDLVRRVDLGTTAVIVTADHGHLPEGGHGGSEETVLRTPLVLAGKGIRRGARSSARQTDVAPTLAALLGLPLPAASQGRILLEALDLDEATRLALLRAQLRQKAAFARAYGRTLGASSLPSREVDHASLPSAIADIDARVEQAAGARLRAERAPRLPVFLAGMIVPLTALVYLGRRTPWADVGAMLAGVAGYFGAYHLLLTAWGIKVSLSAINDEQDLPAYLLRIMIVAVVAMILSVALACGLARRSAADAGVLAARGLGVVGGIVFLLGARVGAVYWRHGLFPAWQLPDMGAAFPAFVTLVQLLAVASGAVAAPLIAWLVYHAFRRRGRSEGARSEADSRG